MGKKKIDILPSGKITIDGEAETRDVSIAELEAFLGESDRAIEILPSGEVQNRDGTPLTQQQIDAGLPLTARGRRGLLDAGY